MTKGQIKSLAQDIIQEVEDFVGWTVYYEYPPEDIEKFKKILTDIIESYVENE